MKDLFDEKQEKKEEINFWLFIGIVALLIGILFNILFNIK